MKIEFYSCINDSIIVTVGGESWDECLPYNDETKHLVGTTNDVPEKYKI